MGGIQHANAKTTPRIRIYNNSERMVFSSVEKKELRIKFHFSLS